MTWHNLLRWISDSSLFMQIGCSCGVKREILLSLPKITCKWVCLVFKFKFAHYSSDISLRFIELVWICFVLFYLADGFCPWQRLMTQNTTLRGSCIKKNCSWLGIEPQPCLCKVVIIHVEWPSTLSGQLAVTPVRTTLDRDLKGP